MRLCCKQTTCLHVTAIRNNVYIRITNRRSLVIRNNYALMCSVGCPATRLNDEFNEVTGRGNPRITNAGTI